MDYCYKSKKVEELGDKYKGDTGYLLNKAAYDGDIKTLATLVKLFAAQTIKDPYEAIDTEIEKGKTIANLYQEIYEGLNTSFFAGKLKADTETPPMNIAAITREMTDKMSAEMTTAIMPTLSEKAAQQLTEQV